MTEPGRYFLALWPDATTLRSLEMLQQRLQATGLKARRVPRENLHLTLAFLGGMSPARLQHLVEALATVRASAPLVELSRLGAWRRSRVVYVAPEQDASCLAELLQRLRPALSAVARQHCLDDFRAHITLFRSLGLAPNNWLDIQCIAWRASRMALVQSSLTPQGAVYRTLNHWDLA